MRRTGFAAVLIFLAAGALGALHSAGRSPQAPQSARALELTADKFKCGKDAEIGPIPLRWSTVVLAADGRLYMPCPNATHRGVVNGLADREIYERMLLASGLQSRDPEIRWRAAQAYARIGLGAGAVIQTAVVTPVCNAEAQIFGGIVNPIRWQPGELFRMLKNPDLRVRREAVYALGVALSRPGLDANVATAARKEIEACLITAGSAEVTPLLLEAIGVTRYGKDEDRAAAAVTLVQGTRSILLPVVLGAVKGLEALIRQAPGWEVGEPARVQLRDLLLRERPNVSPSQVPMAQRIKRLAMAALQAARDADVATLDQAANDRDWQVRRLIAMMLNLADAAQARIGDRLSADPAFQVRYDYLSPLSRLVTRTRLCAPLASYLEDPEPTVIMRAMDLINAQCTDLDDAVEQLKDKAGLIEKAESYDNWHLPARALTALARVRPADARPLMSPAMKHPVWQVRAHVAAALAGMGMADDVLTLARDRVPNVQTAAIEALVRAKNAGVIEPALDVLRYGSDFQVLRAAAGAVNSVPEEKRNAAADALLIALRRLTDLGEDPSRDPRVAILAALGRVMPANRTNELLAFVSDVDDEVNAAAAKAFESAGGIAAPEYVLYRRYPYQPTELAITTLPTEAVIQLEQGAVVIDLLPAEAPVTIARFAALAKVGYYDGLTFHRIVPNFVVQGGSPGASEYVGAARFMRDEVSPASHTRGAVGISTRGKDTGDAQIFIDLVDLPRLDRDYTVFGYVKSGMEFVDRMLEGARIKSVTVR